MNKFIKDKFRNVSAVSFTAYPNDLIINFSGFDEDEDRVEFLEFIFNKIKERIKNLNIKVSKIDSYGLDGDMIESQMFGYIAVRSIKKLPLSLPTTTGVVKPTSGGRLFGKLKN